MNEDSADFSEDDGLDEFEESVDEKKRGGGGGRTNNTFKDKPYDEAYEISQDLSVAESFDARDKFNPAREKERKIRNERYDEVVEVSQSLDNVNLAAAAAQKGGGMNVAPALAARPDAKGVGAGAGAAGAKDSKDSKEDTLLRTNTDQTRSQTVLNKHFDEALEFSQSGSDESIDTTNKHKAHKPQLGAVPQAASSALSGGAPASRPMQQASGAAPGGNTAQGSLPSGGGAGGNSSSMTMTAMMRESAKSKPDEHSDEEENEAEESYEHIEGAYNAKDYANLNVPLDVRDLFQYIERYKPQEVELETPLKCFIPEYIPAIGELDAFLKIPRPDDKEDGTGLKFLDEPASNQSDPTVLELNLRAKSKKLQYSDMVVRSIEQAEKNPHKIDKWIHDINELHRNKPPVQVNYRKNMPDLDSLMEAWPAEVEALLNSAAQAGGSGSFVLPSPDLDVSLVEYVRILCAVLDIPVYENPVESLHQFFSLYLEFRNNPHFQDRFPDLVSSAADAKEGGGGGGGGGGGAKYGGADVLELGGESDSV